VGLRQPWQTWGGAKMKEKLCAINMGTPRPHSILTRLDDSAMNLRKSGAYVCLPGAINKGGPPGATLGAGAALTHGLEDGVARPHLPHTLPRGDESAMNRLDVVREPVRRGDR
jgi:hypothetical protein